MEKNKGNLEWIVLITVIIGTFLGRIDQTIVNLAIPHIIDDFSISVSAAGWIATAYILANAIFVPVWGKLGDKVGRKKIYLFGFGLFIVSSILAGLSWNLGSLISFRVIQAIAGSADYPTAMAIIAVTFQDEKKRSQALGIWSASFAAAAIFGPLIGGPLIDLFGWRSVFLVNLPIGIVGMLMAFVFVHESTSTEKKAIKFDWYGSIVLGIVLSAIVLVLDKGNDWGWLSLSSLACFLVFIISGVAFYKIEKNHPEPIVNLNFFKNKLFTNTLINNFIVFMALMGSVFLIPVFAQTFLGYSTTEAGLLYIPMAIFFIVSSPIGGSFIGKVQPRYTIAVSTLIAAIGIFMLHSLDARSTAMDIMLPLSVMAFGMGLGMAQRTSIIASAVPEKDIGTASSVLTLVRNIAGAFGIAIFATILANLSESRILKIAQLSSLHSTNPADYPKFIELIILKAQISTYGTIFLVAGIIMLVGAALSLMIIAEKTKKNVKIHVE